MAPVYWQHSLAPSRRSRQWITLCRFPRQTEKPPRPLLHVPHVVSARVRAGGAHPGPGRSDGALRFGSPFLIVIEENILAFDTPPTLIAHFALLPASHSDPCPGSCLIDRVAPFSLAEVKLKFSLHTSGMLHVSQALVDRVSGRLSTLCNLIFTLVKA